MKKEKIQIGLDIGTTSVGWAILKNDNDNVNIIDTGVRLFDDVVNAKTGITNAKERREKRQLRRIISRRKNRKQSLINLLIKYNIVSNKSEVYKYVEAIDVINLYKFIDNSIEKKDYWKIIPAKIKVYGLEHKFSNKELLVFCLYNYVSHRGTCFNEYNPDNVGKNTSKNKKSNENNFIEEINKIKQEFKDSPSKAIVKCNEKFGYYKGTGIQDVHNEQWKQEIKQFSKIQELDENFVNEYLKLFNSYDYSKGPNIYVKNSNDIVKNPSAYGLYDSKINKVYNNLWEKNTGKCSFYPDEPRGAKNSIFAEVFNLLNDISNFYINGDKENKLDNNRVQMLFENLDKLILSPKVASFTFDRLFDKILTKDEISYSIENNCGLKQEKEKPVVSKCKNYFTLIKWLIENKILDNNFSFLDLDLLDKLNNISNIYHIYKNIDEIKFELEKLILNKFNKEIKFNNDIKIPNLIDMSKTHSLSYKALLEYISYFKSTKIYPIHNWQQYRIEELNRKSENNQNKSFKNKYISKSQISDFVISPTVKRAFNQSINVLNAIIKQYSKIYDIEHITIELAREKNSVEEKNALDKINRENKKKVEETLKNTGSILDKDIEKEIEKLSNTQKLRIKLWYSQDKKDIYNNKEISYQEVISGDDLDIDHIIPYSFSNDDSQNNKVLCYKYNNKNKSNRTPYEWLKNGEFEQFKNRVEDLYNNKKISKYKRENLLKEHFDSISNGFVARQLVDTRYACILLKETLEKHFFNNQNFENENNKVVVNNVRGGVTSYFKKILRIKNNLSSEEIKDRDEFNHHAIDACVIAYLGSNQKMRNLFSFSEMVNNNNEKDWKNDEKSYVIVNHKTGEVIDFNNENFYKLSENKSLFQLKQQIQYLINEQDQVNGKGIKFSRMIETIKNVKISNETIYRVRWDEKPRKDKKVKGIQYSYINLIKDKMKDLNKYFGKNVDESLLNNLLCFKEDKSLYNKLNNIYNDYYKDEKINPFIEYMEQIYNIKNPSFIKLDEIQNNIKKLKYTLKDKIFNTNVIVLDKHIRNENYLNSPIMSSLGSIRARIYKNDKGDFVPCPLNILVLKYDEKSKSMIIDENKLQNFLTINNITNRNNFIELRKGMTLIKNSTNELFYSIGTCLAKAKKIEIKRLDKRIKSEGQLQRPIHEIINEYSPIEIDTLGKVIKKSWNI